MARSRQLRAVCEPTIKDRRSERAMHLRIEVAGSIKGEKHASRISQGF
jgi:hypothetical protein